MEFQDLINIVQWEENKDEEWNLTRELWKLLEKIRRIARWN